MSLEMKKYILLLLTAGLMACGESDDPVPDPDEKELNKRETGASARELLSAEKYASVRIEIQYMPGYKLQDATIDNIKTFLAALVNKPGGIEVIQTEVSASGKAVLAIGEIRAIEENNRRTYTTGDRLGLYMLVTDGHYTDENTLGAAYLNTSMCLFGKNIHDNSGSIGQASRVKLESTVVEHEIGHLLGLVGLDPGSPMQTDHRANGNHCNNEDCLMYYAAETTDILGFLITGGIPQLDANCRADLEANGGK